MDSIHDGRKRVIYSLATGGGKTTVMAEIIRQLLANGEKVLCIVHRKEIVLQIFDRVRDHCDLTLYDIGIEQNIEHAATSCRVVVGNSATVKSAHRLAWFHPTVIITDEAHRAGAVSYRKIYARFGVPGTCIHIGCTATPKRTDRQSLYALHFCCDNPRCNGECGHIADPVVITDKKGQKHFASFEESVFERLVFKWDILEGINDGYLVPVVGHTAQTETDLSKVETDTDGDFKEGQLQEAVNNDPRNQKAISSWIEAGCQSRPTLVFTAGIAHAHEVAKAFRNAGFSAAALDGTTDSDERAHTVSDFKAGHLQVLVNMGLFTEGTDIPNCACIIHMRPTKSWNLYVQMCGRGFRTLPGVIDMVFNPDTGVWEGPKDSLERCAAIEWSDKPDCVILDLADICGKHDLCALPVILDLPAKLDLQGNSLTAAKRMIDDFGDAAEHLSDDGSELPLTFQKLQVKLTQIDLIRNAKDHGSGWKVTNDGFRFMDLPPGYTAELLPAGDNQYRLLTKHMGKELIDVTGRPTENFKRYLACAALRSEEAVREHRDAIAADRAGEVCMIGKKYRDIPVKDVPLGYLRWAYKNMDCLRYPQYSKLLNAIGTRVGIEEESTIW
jgi:superfamily II DNA or RNA helicase